jgi:AcrR family transcriptional regulator
MAMSTGKIGPSRSLSAADWVRAAMEAIVQGGVAAVAIEPIAIRLGATKGSFYHHFENRDALIVAALEEWERIQTDEVIQRLRLMPDPAERLRAVMASAVADRAGGVRDAALLGSATHPLVHPVVERVTARRLEYITQVYGELGFSKASARRRALLLYSAYLGLFDYLRAGIADDMGDAELRAYVQEYLAILVPSGEAL